jgi:hypothetical protein
MLRKIPALATLCVTFLLVLSAALAMANEQAPSDPPSGQVSMTFGRGGFIVSAGGGHGVLTFNGAKYPFKVVEAGIGGIGGAKVIASGEVYHLSDVKDFPGTYGQLSAGFAAFNKGEGVLWLKNTSGVVLKLKARQKGFELSAGGQGLVIKMRGKKKKQDEQ